MVNKSTLVTVSAVLIAVLAYGWVFSPVRPVINHLPPLPVLDDHENLLLKAEHLFKKSVVAPESFAVDSSGRIYVSTASGEIFRLSADASSYEFFAQTGEKRDNCGKENFEHICGRPLGMAFDSDGNLIVADAYKGLLSFNKDGKKFILATEVGGQKLKFANSVAIGPDGLIYFTDSSLNFERRRVPLELLDGRATGRLMVYDPAANTSRLLLKDLAFPNGISFTHDGTALLIASCSHTAIYRYDLRTSELSLWSPNLPGVPDNITQRPGRGTYYVALGTKRAQPFSLLQFLNSFPEVRRLLGGLLPCHLLISLVPKIGIVVELDETGAIVRTLVDTSGRTSFLSEAREIGDFLYLGSWRSPFLARVPLSTL